MITRETLKQEIDHISEDYLLIVFKILKSFEETGYSDAKINKPIKKYNKRNWQKFINNFSGIFTEDPLYKAAPLDFEIRDRLK